MMTMLLLVFILFFFNVNAIAARKKVMKRRRKKNSFHSLVGKKNKNDLPILQSIEPQLNIFQMNSYDYFNTINLFYYFMLQQKK